jgi:hypothetical protein
MRIATSAAYLRRETHDWNLIQFEARKRQFEEELALRLARASFRPDKHRHRGRPAGVIARAWAFVTGLDDEARPKNHNSPCDLAQCHLRVARRGEKIAPKMRIESIEAEAVSVPLTAPTAFSTREIKGREYLIVRIVDESGASGIRYTYAGDSGGLWRSRSGRETSSASSRSLFRSEFEDRLAVTVSDSLAGEWFFLDAESDHALDVSYHPYEVGHDGIATSIAARRS